SRRRTGQAARSPRPRRASAAGDAAARRSFRASRVVAAMAPHVVLGRCGCGCRRGQRGDLRGHARPQLHVADVRRPSMKRALLLLACSCGADATRVHVDVAHAPINLDSYQLRVGDRDGTVGAVSAFDVWLPDDMAGVAQPVKLWGVANAKQIAYGET